MHPVKTILADMSLMSTAKSDENPVVDVWDRQWLSTKLAKVHPAQASMFFVNLRLTNLTLQQLLTQSGAKGLYYEPRDESGRMPHSAYRVVWLPGVGRAAAQAAIQTSPHWASLARQGARFGLRIHEQHAEATHKIHKPQAPYLSSTQLKSFTVGPLPYNCTRSSLAKLFQVWEWRARAIQPRGRARDGTGVVWQVLSEGPPESEVYQMAHGDVIITVDEDRRQTESMQPVNLLASAKTVAALREKPNQATSSTTKDPWEDSDPWQPYKSKQIKHSPPEISPHQLRAIEESLKEKSSLRCQRSMEMWQCNLITKIVSVLWKLECSKLNMGSSSRHRHSSSNTRKLNRTSQVCNTIWRFKAET